MKTITNDQYNEYMQFKQEKRDGHILDINGIAFIVKANNYNAELIGRHILEAYWRIKKKGV